MLIGFENLLDVVWVLLKCLMENGNKKGKKSFIMILCNLIDDGIF